MPSQKSSKTPKKRNWSTTQKFLYTERLKRRKDRNVRKSSHGKFPTRDALVAHHKTVDPLGARGT